MKLMAEKRGASRAGDRLIDQSHQLRAKIFGNRLGWNVRIGQGREFDEYDDLTPTYILATDDAHARVIGCARLLPGDGPTMLGGTFPELLDGSAMPFGKHLVESSRFCVDTLAAPEAVGPRGVHLATSALFAGILEWAIANECTDVITVTDLRLERIFSRAGLAFTRLGLPRQIGNTVAVAGTVPVSLKTLLGVRPAEYNSIDFNEIERAA